MRLLIIDDQKNVTQSLKEVIEPSGHECVVQNNPGRAIKQFQKKHFDAVITDYRMPGMTGGEVLKSIHELNPKTPVIMLTGYADTKNALEALNHDAWAFYQKPINVKQLLKTLSEIELWINDNVYQKSDSEPVLPCPDTNETQLKENSVNISKLLEGMIHLKHSFAEGSKITEIFCKLKKRIHTYSEIHDQIKECSENGSINLETYQTNLMQKLYQSCPEHETGIQLIQHLEPIHVPENKAFAWGLIIHELFTNCTEHAFDENQKNKQLRIVLKMDSSNNIMLSVDDNGKGFPSSLNLEHPNTLGLYLVSSLTKNTLDGTVNKVRDTGAHIHVIAEQPKASITINL